MVAKKIAGKMPKGNKIFGNLKNLGIFVLVVIGIVLMLSGSVSAYSAIGGGICKCGNNNITSGGNATDACVDCTAALNDDANCTNQVNYVGTVNITNYIGTCIDNPANFNNKIFDCQGHTIDGDDSGDNIGIYLSNRTNNTIKNCNVTQFWAGISFGYNGSSYTTGCSNNTLTNNIANNNTHSGIVLHSSSNNNTLTNNIANNNAHSGILLHSSSNNNNLTNNTANSNNLGIVLSSSSNNALTNNTANSNIWGDGIYLRSSSNNTLTNNTANSNGVGIVLSSSSNNALTNNTANSNIWGGIHLYSSSNNNLTNNTANSNGQCESWECYDVSGIYLDSSSNNNILTNNTANSNTYGIFLDYFSNNNITNNTANYNTYYGIYLYASSSNTLTSNTANSNKYGIYLSSSSNNILTNNTANSNNQRGIYLYYSSSNTLTSNTANSNKYGIYLNDHSSSNNIVNNTVNSNYYTGISLNYYSASDNKISNNKIRNNGGNGVYFDSNSTGNLLNSNTICLNNIDVNDGDSNQGDNNTCNLQNNWNDTGTTGCTSSCPQTTCYCSNCSDCTAKMDSDCSIVILTDDVINYTGTCIDNPYKFNGKTFDCQGHTIDGDDSGSGHGIYLNGNSWNTIRNCIITDFSKGIYFQTSSSNTLTNNTANSNNFGIYLYYSSNNNIVNNTVNSNSYEGISLYDSSNNIIANNTANSNNDTGIFLYYSSNNILTNNTANSNSNGILLDSSTNSNTLTNNTANSNNERGIYILDYNAGTLGGKYEQDIKGRTIGTTDLEGSFLSSNPYGSFYSTDGQLLANGTLSYTHGMLKNYNIGCQIDKSVSDFPMGVKNYNELCLLCYDPHQELKHPDHEMKESIIVDGTKVKYYEYGLGCDCKAESLKMKLDCGALQYTVDLEGIPVSDIKDGNDLIDSSYRGKMLFMGSNDYFVNHLYNNPLYIVLAKGEKLQISSAGYTEPALSQLQGYKFKLLKTIQSNGKDAGVVMEIEKPDGTTVQAKASIVAGTSLETDAKGHQIQIQAFRVMGNTANIIAYDMSTQYKLENNKKKDGWLVKIDTDYCNKVGIEEYGTSTSPVGNANTKRCLTKVTLTLEDAQTMNVGDKVYFPTKAIKFSFDGFKDEDFGDPTCSGGNDKIKIGTSDNRKVMLNFTTRDGQRMNSVRLDEGGYELDELFLIGNTVYKFRETEDINNDENHVKLLLTDVSNANDFEVTLTKLDASFAGFTYAYFNKYSANKENPCSPPCSIFNGTVWNDKNIMAYLQGGKLWMDRQNDNNISLNDINLTDIQNDNCSANLSVIRENDIDLNAEGWNNNTDDEILVFQGCGEDMFYIDFYDTGRYMRGIGDYRTSVKITGEEDTTTFANQLRCSNDTKLWSPRGADQITVTNYGTNKQVNAVEICHPTKPAYITYFIGKEFYLCNCTKFDFDNNTALDIFDVVRGLEKLANGDSISNEECSRGNDNKFGLFDIFELIEKIVNKQ